MRARLLRRTGPAFLLVLLAGCNGNIGGHEPSGGTGPIGPGGPTNVMPGGVTVPPTPFDAATALVAVRKVENLLTGMAPTDDDVSLVTQQGAAGLQQLISKWMTTDPYQTALSGKMIGLFRNMFQQTGFTPTEDFKIQLLQNGGFDFGPFGTSAVGDDSFARLVQNLQDSFAMTAWQIVKEGQPFTNTLTTHKFVMTTGLKMLYIQVEMPADAPFGNQNATPAWTIDLSGGRAAIPLETALATMNFSDEAPANATTGFGGSMPCSAGTGTYNGTSLLFQRMIGFTPRFPFSANPTCFEHASKPYLTTDDVSDWNWVTINQAADPTNRAPAIQPYDLPTLRQATELTLSLPRVGFYTTPAFLALWNTNDSNQHRVTANQTLLVALGQAFTAENSIVPFSTTGLDATHAVAGSECVGCHATLDPMRNFWANQLDYNDRNDFPARANFMGGSANPRPKSIVDEFAFGDFRATGASMNDLGGYLSQVTDGNGHTRFAIAVTQQLCFYANSAPCSESDAEFQRVVTSFMSSNYNFAALTKEFFASPLVTGAVPTGTYTDGQVPVSVSRRDHLCAALSNRLGKADICAQIATLPTSAQTATAKIAASITADAFSRGAQSPVTPSDPTLFYRSATEMLCENVAVQVVDAASGSVYSSSDVAGSIKGMVETIMGYPPSSPLHDQAVQILTDHNTMAASTTTTGGGTGRPGGSTGSTSKATNALRSTFVLACESPTALGIGL
jgi:hypothetical protein